MLDTTDHLIGIVVSLLAVVGGLAAWLRWVRPKWRRLGHDYTAGRDALVGREAIYDSITGQEIEPALPGIGVRMAHQEEQSREQRLQLQILTDAVSKIAESHTRLDGLEGRVKVLEDARLERVVVQAESAAMFHAVTTAREAEQKDQS